MMTGSYGCPAVSRARWIQPVSIRHLGQSVHVHLIVQLERVVFLGGTYKTVHEFL